ncbi:wax ester/triacylglycerol synthase family O-acyltransferase [Mycolicibacterium goodii]|uniref:wax ester/triacylglycerol synthase family O-acyltransferase n=1 Tax=Mycolicibacterium goodii TaxID=134601 RepID=UPI001BDC40E5|nr:wax ester/triacylglycerol synthase family O-acyltransferase [Mycolicibacterium goodii]MBU8831887.1 wax ester/triacylglycerol synthase family O-acyltransferase [Mycolicibacterium goodii]
MDRLSALDVAFLEAEDADRNVSLAIGVLSILEGPPPADRVVLGSVYNRLLSIPRFTQIVDRQPLDLSAPQWVEAHEFSVAHHVRRTAVPQPGDDAALFGVVADIMERRLDRSRPLWECWIIEGLPSDQWAILMKIHHCIADGIAVAQLLSYLSDEGTVDSFTSDIDAAKQSAPQKHQPFEFTLNPVRLIRSAIETTASVGSEVVRVAEGALQIATGLLDPHSLPLRGRVSDLRRYASTQVSLSDVGRICHAYDVTINDVALAAITDSFRAAMIRRGERPGPRSLRTLVPVSVRSSDAAGQVDNRVSLMLPCLPVDIRDPVEQLLTVHQRMENAKRTGQRQAGSVFVSAVNSLPSGITTLLVRAAVRMPQQSVVTLATNVPGPRKHLELLGHRVVRVVPIPPIALGLRTGVAILSYADDLVFGITADFDAIPDVEVLAEDIGRAVVRLAATADLPTRRTPSAILTLVTTPR